ncbi:MAG: FMN-binding protein [Acholeplasmataceae bacterium]|nr:MAG: FMN-binding protein [Acholeplasmataceae bacterium]
MKSNVQVFIFVIILGVVTSVLLLGADALTSERIIANREAELQSTILDAYGVTYTFGNISTVFEDRVEVVTVDDFTFYVDKETSAVSYVFEGSGLWGPIVGIISLEADFETILSITIFQQQETPGLGGRVAERRYLDTFAGVKMVPVIVITRDGADGPNEADAITGATGTSTAFENILNASYDAHRSAWLSVQNGG